MLPSPISTDTMDPFSPDQFPHAQELYGLLDQLEGKALWRHARASRKSILEVGTYCGYSALYLAYGIRSRPKEHQQDVQIFTVDTHRFLSPRHIESVEMLDMYQREEACTFRQFTRNCKHYGVWDLIYPIVDDAEHAWRHGLDAPCDLAFIDGDHTVALRDFRNWSPLIDIGGIVCFHDYSTLFPQVIMDVDLLVSEEAIEKIESVGSLLVARLLRHSPR